MFARYFFEVWDKLESAIAKKPVYFRYLTLLSYHVFIQQGVDIAIYEVGVGGEYDSTNVVDKPAVTGISHLGIDHTYTLGNTIEEIAWHKAGIQKPYVPSFTVRQEPEAQSVVTARSHEKKVQSLRILGVDPRLDGVHIRPDADFQRSNASLAIALAGELLSKIGILGWRYAHNTEMPLPKEFIDGLEKVVWRGRCEVKREDNITWYLDGAHTPHSMVAAAKWFNDLSLKQYVLCAR
jgi:folylpolyglutamate synthase/dihydrofolate synthase